MMLKLIPVFLFLTVCAAPGSSFAGSNDYTSLAPVTAQADDLHHLSAPKLKAPAFSRGGGGDTYVYFTDAIMLGGGSIKATGPNGFSNGGFLYGGELGVDIMFPARSDRSDRMLTIYIAGQVLETDKLNIQVAGLPIYYTYLRYGGDHGAGFYFQAGADIDYLVNAKDKDGNNEIAHCNRLLLEPAVSMGIHFPYVLMRRRREVEGGRMFIGPFYSYTVSNMSKDDGVSMHGYKLGIRICYILMHGAE